MKNFQFLQKYEQLQEGIMFDKFVNLGFAMVSFCQGDDSAFWNHALTNQLLTKDKLLKIEETMKSLSRQPAIYFENKGELQPLLNFLKNNGYKFSFEDSWMFHSGKNIDASRFRQVRKIKDGLELEVFLRTFDACYQKDDPQNPYGELGEYLKMAKEAWHKHHQSERIEYFLIYDGKKPVAVSSLTNFAGIGYISNVGSLKEVRGHGFGKVASLYCVAKSVANGNTQHALATEEGHYPNEFYKRIGFKTRFTAVGYVNE